MEGTARPAQFGRHAATGNMAVTAYLHSDVIVTGRMLGDSALGTYRMAMYLASAPAEKISMLIMRTAGPLFANLQSDPPLVRRYFLLLADTLSLAVVPAMVGLVMVAPEAVQVVLGQEWREAAGPLVWLAVYMIVATMSSLVGQVLMSQRMTKFTMRMSLVNLCVMPLAFVAGAHWGGIRGVAAAWVIASPITFLPSAIVLLRRINLTLRECIVTLWPTVLSAFVMLLALKATRTAVISTAWPLATKLFVQVAVGALTHSAVILIFFPDKLQRYVRFVRGVLGRKSAEPAVSASAAPL